jgi:flagellar motor switch protein FliG
MTNGDYIRSMDDEELAAYLAEVERQAAAHFMMYRMTNLASDIFEWLEEEFEDY